MKKSLISMALSALCPAVFGNSLKMGFGPDAIPNAADFDRFRVTNTQQSEVIRQRLYDFQLYPTAGQAIFQFFSLPQGQGKTSTPGAVAGTGKTLSDTNMTGAGLLPSGMQYLIESIEIVFLPGSVNTADTYTPAKFTTDATGALLAASISAVNDLKLFYQTGLVKFNVLNKIQLTETPCGAFPPKTWMELDSSLATTNSTLSLAFANARPMGRPYYLEPPISLQPTVNFGIGIEYPAAQATPSGFNGRVGVILDGYLMRASQ